LIHSELFIAYFRLARHPGTIARKHIAGLASTDQVGLPPSGCLEIDPETPFWANFVVGSPLFPERNF